CLTLRIELRLEPPDLFVIGCNQRCLLLFMGTNQIEQRLAIKCIEILQRCAIHGSQYAIRSSKRKRGKPASILRNHDDHQTATSGVHVRSTLRQSMPSRSIESCARLSRTTPLSAFGQMNRPRSRRLANRQSPSPSHQRSLTISPRLPRNTKTCPENGCSCNTFCTCALSPSNPRRRSVTPAAIQTLVPTGSWITGQGSPGSNAIESHQLLVPR